MKIKKLHAVMILFIIIFGGIGLSIGFNYWSTKTNKIPIKIKAGEFAGSYDPSDVRGSYEFKNIAGLFDIPLEDLQDAFSVPDDQINIFKCKDLESLDISGEVEIGTKSVRIFVAMYTGLPIELSDDSPAYLPKEAATIIKEKGNPTEEQLEYLDKYTAN